MRPRMRIPDRASDAETALLRYLVYGVLPAWFIPGLLDWNQHRRSRIERNAGTRESVIHMLMMAEVGMPIMLALLFEIN
ncbi:MAG TPA: diguanylate cyclase/phosphodiesterase, partial [Mycobacterium sp.]|nr:diguanylate cyclase/phosphodiesterase [Mycobacterium sp.]